MQSLFFLQSVTGEPAGPFFSNNLEGLLRVVGVFGGVAAGVIAFIWKVMRGNLQEKDKELETQIRAAAENLGRDINAVGSRVNGIETSCTQNGTRTEELRLQLSRATQDSQTALTGLAEMRAELRSLREQSVESKTDIIAHITNSQMQVLQATGATNERLAHMEGQVELLGKLLKGPPFGHARSADAS